MPLTSTRVVVAGAAGFIGAVVSQQLLDAGHEVLGIDNLNDYYSVGLKRSRIERLDLAKHFQFVRCDILDENSLQAAIRSQGPFQAIINLAAQAGVRNSFLHPKSYFRTNVMGCHNLLRVALDNSISKFVLASSSTLYANCSPPFREDAPIGTVYSPYAESKKTAELLVEYYHDQHQIDTTVLRYFTVYGPAGRPDMCYLQFAKAIDREVPITLYGDGTQTRDFTFVDDIARGTILALEPVGFQVVNLGGGGEPISINQLIHQIGRLLGKEPKVHLHPRHQADMGSTQANIEKAASLFGWKPQTEFQNGLEETIRWYKTHRYLFPPPPAIECP